MLNEAIVERLEAVIKVAILDADLSDWDADEAQLVRGFFQAAITRAVQPPVRRDLVNELAFMAYDAVGKPFKHKRATKVEVEHARWHVRDIIGLCSPPETSDEAVRQAKVISDLLEGLT